ncbi:unnamed protein product [Rotaria sp. Silwood2]|nr:unnamed protein product [Rotaria sp. Silwood2]CAF3396438.1 unnamed protein product [Rotaria sp. Silwood2]CAF3397256.1 unnamed protein product [Rotaria sp. Silwood2]CAF4587889.1 unnamed protein product [Rotaria sp. Silwood2]CAF4614456.1 unnamed protein product [Rotaria sp. Silwood2]
MAVQLLSISAVFIFLNVPPMILKTARTAGLPVNIVADYETDSFYFTYFVIFLTPVVSIFSLPELRTKFEKITAVGHQIRRAVVTETLMMGFLTGGRTWKVAPVIQ